VVIHDSRVASAILCRFLYFFVYDSSSWKENNAKCCFTDILTGSARFVASFIRYDRKCHIYDKLLVLRTHSMYLDMSSPLVADLDYLDPNGIIGHLQCIDISLHTPIEKLDDFPQDLEAI
jgi:hypothetical protein